MAKKNVPKRDLVGKEIGNYIVLDDFIMVTSQNGRVEAHWKCRCKCGNELYVPRHTLIRGKTKYCPECKPLAVRKEKLYHVYYGILQRCYNTNNPSYAKYGGRGITMCDEWMASYDTFKEWAYQNGYYEGCNLTIDRVDSSSGYTPDNCRWISLSENSARANIGRQKNHTKLQDVYAVSPDGEVVEIDNIHQFCVEHNMNKSNVHAALHGRISNHQYGWTFHSNESRS